MTDVKRPFLLQLGYSQDELCKPDLSASTTRESLPKRQITKPLNSVPDRSSTCSSQSSQSSSSSNGSEISSPSLILPYLYVGDQAQTQIDTISSLNISYILSLQSLPKFLSGSPKSTPPPTPTATSLPPALSSSTSSSSSNKADVVFGSQNNQSVLTNSTRIAQTKVAQQSGSDGGSPKIDIIDGADGGLLPSVNSSKDYLVKIKHLASEKDKQKDVGVTKTTANEETIDEAQPMDFCDDEGLFVQKLQTHSTQALSNSEISSCEDHPSSQTVVGENNFDNDLESALRDCFSQTIADEQQYINEASTSASGDDGLAEDQGYSMAANTGSSCSLKQRCNRLSSSVHRLIRGKCINISDTFEQLLDKFFDETHSFIEEARRNKCNVLVHCKAGISRSPTIAIAYLMKWKRLHLQDAYNFVKRCRPQISPNLNFMGQLVSYERQLQRDRSHLPSPTSSCLPSLGPGMSCNQQHQQQHQAVPNESSSSSSAPSSGAQQKDTTTSPKHGFSSSSEAKRAHMVSRRSNNHHHNNNSPTTDRNSYDSNTKRARVRSFFRRKS